MNAQIEPVTGHYLRINFRGRPHRIYYEDSGQGIPLICLHTAGSDTRQYRGVQNDPEVLSKFRVVAFDMPWHGKSSPPPGFEKESHSLDADLYMDTIWAVADALGLEKPVIMGCSMGRTRRASSGDEVPQKDARGDRLAVRARGGPIAVGYCRRIRIYGSLGRQ